MASLERRIEALERLYGQPPTAGNEERARLVDDFMRRALDATAHVRRGPIDAPPWAYAVEGLRSESPITVAAYVAALAALEHQDEARAREILDGLERERGLDPDRHEKLIGAYQTLAGRHSG